MRACAAIGNNQDDSVSIITPTFNSARYLKATFETIRSQSHSNWEWIVVDDASVDSTRAIIEQAEREDSRVRPLLLPKNGGPAVARNAALDCARGKYVAFLDADDLWRPDKLALQLVHVTSKKLAFSFTGYELISQEGTPLGKQIDCAQERLAFDYQDMLRKRATIGCSTVLLSRDFIGDTRMPLLRSGQDYAFWLKLLRRTDAAHLLPESLTYYRLVPGSVSRNKLKKALRQWQIYRNQEQLNLIEAAGCFANYAIRAITR